MTPNDYTAAMTLAGAVAIVALAYGVGLIIQWARQPRPVPALAPLGPWEWRRCPDGHCKILSREDRKCSVCDELCVVAG